LVLVYSDRHICILLADSGSKYSIWSVANGTLNDTIPDFKRRDLTMPLIIEVKAVPRAGRHGWSLDKGGKLKVHLKSAPEGYAANKELIKSLAEAVRISQSKVEIVAGVESRNKRIKIGTDITFDQLLQALGIEQQQELFTKK